MNIPFDSKFTENHLDFYLNKYFEDSFSEKENRICFDLSIVEWISVEEVCFLFSWIRKLKQLYKEVNIILPFPYELSTSNSITDETRRFLGKSNKFDSQDSIARRKRLNLFLLGIWGMLDRLGVSDLDFINIIEGYNKKIETARSSQFSHQVIPFTVLDSSLNKARKTYVDTEFNSVLHGKKTKNDIAQANSVNPVFDMKADIVNLLTSYSCFSPFESKIISHIITKELFINSLEHSGEDECYLTVSFNNKWGTAKGTNFVNHFISEKDSDTLDFFKDKLKILKKQESDLQKVKRETLEKEGVKREASLVKYKDDFRDISYVQFTFLDFGIGIHKSLYNSFLRHKEQRVENKEEINEDLDLHSQILEYAFQIESSRNPYERDIEYSELIPRGLYFLVDMVRRFKGLLVARSGNGKVIYDFSDKIFLEKINDSWELNVHRVYEAKDAIRVNNTQTSFFNGSMFTIVLPERKIEDLKRTPVRVDNHILNSYVFNFDKNEQFPREVFAPERYEYLSMVFVYHEAIKNLPVSDLHDKSKVNGFIFRKIDNVLSELQNTSSVLFIDFEFLYERSNYIKIISWLTNSPKVNELTKVVIFNLTEDESSVIKEFKENYSYNDTNNDVEFLFKPIPCIRISNATQKKITAEEIDWVGVNNENDIDLLNNLFLGVKDCYPESSFDSPWVAEGHLFSKFQGNTYSIFADFESLIQEFKKAKIQFLKTWIINNEVIDGDKPKEGKKKHLFLTSRGSYQDKYISLYETLHNKYVARVYAKVLLDKYIEKCLTQGQTIENLYFDKIIVVTVSSQLIGLAIRDLINDNDAYGSLCIRDVRDKKVSPKLIRLSSYFSFDTEKPFEDIKSGDKVIIVNDVISTGALIQRLTNGIDEKEAVVKSIMTIVDDRFSVNKTDPNKEIESYEFDESIENKIVYICSSVGDKELKIRKFKKKPLGDYEIKRINPILNTVVELSYRHSEKNRVLFEEFEDFINQDFSKEEVYRIGHFVQNLTHNGFYTDMNILFGGQNGEKTLLTIKDSIETNIQYLNLSKNESNVVFIKNALNNIQEIEDIDEESRKKLDEIKFHIEELKDAVQNNTNSNCKKGRRYSPDFIFHPVFSGIENVSDQTFQEVFGTDIDNIVGLQRYDTSVGWRFPFPAKRYNKLTKGKHILIIDSGSLTGDSLIQLVDSISFLEVGRIDFLSVIGRIGDFQREFYSRLKSIKVKSLTQDAEDRRDIDTTVNLNLLFGVNIHIPPYGSRTSCPFCKEIDLLNGYKSKLNGKLPLASSYIERRLLEEICLIEKQDDIKPLHHFPKDRLTQKHDFQNVFIMRDRIGKVASYRFYNEHFTYFDTLADNLGDDYYEDKYILKEAELILICILHETSLVNIVKDLLITNYDIIYNILKDIVIRKHRTTDDLFYDWSKYSILKLYHAFKGNNIYDKSIIESICDYSKRDNQCLEYLSFVLIEPFLQDCSKGLKNRALGIVNMISTNFDNDFETSSICKDETIRRIFKDLLLTFEPVETDDVNQAFYNLKLFFDVVNNQHTKLFRADISLLNTIINNENVEELSEIRQLAHSINKTIKECIYENLKTIKHSSLATKNDWPIHKSLFNVSSSLVSSIEDLENSYEALKKLKKEIDVNVIMDTVRNYQDILVNQIQSKYLLKETSFYTFCNKYFVDLNQCINKALMADDLKDLINERKGFKIEKLNYNNVIVQGHSDYFYYAFHEIFVNAAKRKENDNTTISFNLEKNEKTNEIKLSIYQNNRFIKESQHASGGLAKIIEPVFRSFCGEENIKFITEQPEEYIIELKFNSKELKTTNHE